MIPLRRAKFPDSTAELMAAMDESFRQFVRKDGPIVSISAAEVEFLTGSIKTDGQPGTS